MTSLIPANKSESASHAQEAVGEKIANRAEGRQIELDEALLLAAKNGAKEQVLGLMALGANPQAANRHGNTALMVAARNQNWEAIDALLPTGDGKRTNRWNETALIIGVGNGSPDSFGRMVDLLLPISDPSHADRQKDTALFIAARNGALEAIEKLLAASADPKPKNADGTTLLMLREIPFFGADEDGQKREREWLRLVLKGSDVNAEDAVGHTALMRAVWWNAHGDQFLKMLLPHCDPAHLNSQGKTALDVAAEGKEWWAVEELAKHMPSAAFCKALPHLDKEQTPVAYARAYAQTEANELSASVEKTQKARPPKTSTSRAGVATPSNESPADGDDKPRSRANRI